MLDTDLVLYGLGGFQLPFWIGHVLQQAFQWVGRLILRRFSIHKVHVWPQPVRCVTLRQRSCLYLCHAICREAAATPDRTGLQGLAKDQISLSVVFKQLL